jgi:hypothetical protein
MAKATTTASEKPAKKTRTSRQATVKASDAVTKEEAGAKAPVSSSVDKAPGAENGTPPSSAAPTGNAESGAAGEHAGAVDSTPAGPAADTPSQDQEEAPAQTFTPAPPRAFFWPMGRFPEGWKPTQTPEESAPVEALKSSAWSLPVIAEFPAELTLVNNTRHHLVVRPLSVRVPRFGELTTQCQTVEQYNAITHDFAGRALRERWDSEAGLQVKYDQDQH